MGNAMRMVNQEKPYLVGNVHSQMFLDLRDVMSGQYLIQDRALSD